MSNICNYEMKVVGKKENIEEFIKIIQCDYDYTNMDFDYKKHIGGRVFDADPTDIEKREDGKYEVFIYGSCAWSVSSCMFDGKFSYYLKFLEAYKDKCRSTTITKESKNLELDIEIYSTEPGGCFAEHFIVSNGEIKEQATYDYEEFYFDEYENKADAEKELEISLTDDEWNEGIAVRTDYSHEWTI